MRDGTPFLRVAADRIGAPGSPAKMPFRATNAANWSSIIRIGAKMAVIRRRIARRAVSSHTQRAGRVPYGESRFTHPLDFKGGPPHPKTVQHLCRLADLLGLEKFCPVGCSCGSLISALLYFEMPDRVNKLILNGSGSCFNTEEQLKVALQRAYDFCMPAVTNPTLDACRTMMTFTVHDPASVPEVMLWMLFNSYAQPWMAEAWEAAILGMMKMEEARPYRIFDRLEALDVDTLVPQGREDPSGLYDSAVAAVARMPRARMVTFEKCGHLPNLEHTDAYNRLVREFLKQ